MTDGERHRWVGMVALSAVLGAGCANIGFAPEALDDDDGDDDGPGDDDSQVGDDDSQVGDDDTGPGPDDDVADDDTGVPGAVEVDSVSPAQGAAAGLTQVTIRGSGFTEVTDTALRFGDGVAVVESVNPTEIVAWTPAGAPGTVVDVRVDNSDGTGTLPGAYTYVSDYSGLVGGYLSVGRVDYLDPSIYVTPPSDFSFGIAYFWFPDDVPVWPEIDYGAALPAFGSCGPYDPTAPGTGVTVSPRDAGSLVNLIGPSTVNLPPGDTPDTSWFYIADPLPLTAIATATSYAVQLAGGADIPAQTISPAFTTPPSLNVSPSLANYGANSFNRSAGLTLSLGAPGADGVIVDIGMFEAPSYAYTGSILCRFADAASVTVPSSAFNPYGRGVATVQVTRYSLDVFALEDTAEITAVSRVVVDGALTAN
ncbi:IPT/TIG domain-containing protein [Myxococcota bacterium]|nr:IPT/TIG domain-containing protein [Myxococcota bacterium]